MTLRFIEGFDHLAVADFVGTGKWSSSATTNGTWTLQTGRFGSGNGLRMTATATNLAAYYQKDGLPNMGATAGFAVVGMAYKLSGFNSGVASMSIMDLLDAGSVQLRLGFNTSGQLQVWRGAGATSLGVSTATMRLNSWMYIELKTCIDPTVGTINVRVDGTSVLSLTGQNTRATANSFMNGVRMGWLSLASNGAVNTYDFDDLYVLDSAGSVNNDLLGERRIYTLQPTGAGANTALTIGGSSPAATNWQSVNQTAPDVDVTYVSSATPADTDTYATADLPANVLSVDGVQFNLIARKDDAAARTIAPIHRTSGGTTTAGATSAALTAGYLDYTSIAETSLATASAWTLSEINSSEFGVRVIS